jgi:sec-independent protein translocase protein TatB
MFGGLGWPEVAVLLLLALFVFGPERLPGLAQDAGRALRKLRGYLKGVRDDLAAELGPEVGDLDLASLHPREFVRKHLFEDEEVPAYPRRGVELAPGEPTPWDPDTT